MVDYSHSFISFDSLAFLFDDFQESSIENRIYSIEIDKVGVCLHRLNPLSDVSQFPTLLSGLVKQRLTSCCTHTSTNWTLYLFFWSSCVKSVYLCDLCPMRKWRDKSAYRVAILFFYLALRHRPTLIERSTAWRREKKKPSRRIDSRKTDIRTGFDSFSLWMQL